MKADWETNLWVLLSVLTLAATITFFWAYRLPSADFENENQIPSVARQETGEIEINLEEAQVSKLSGAEKEWEFFTRILQKRDEQLVMDEVTGYLFRDDSPVYQVEAVRGRLDLSSQDIELETVRLKTLEEAGSITGEHFEWEGDEQLFSIRQFSFESPESRMVADQVWYDLKMGRMYLIDNVEIRLKAGE